MKQSFLIFFISLIPIQKFTIIGHSMEPALQNGDGVLVNKLAYIFSSPQKGDIVAVKVNGKVFTKRISAINKEQYFLVGDNSEDSLDSRMFGAITRTQIIGKVIA